MTSREQREILGRNIRSIRKEAGLTQSALAEPLHCTPAYISMIESGKAGITVDMLVEVAELLGVAPRMLLDQDCPHRKVSMAS